MTREIDDLILECMPDYALEKMAKGHEILLNIWLMTPEEDQGEKIRAILDQANREWLESNPMPLNGRTLDAATDA